MQLDNNTLSAVNIVLCIIIFLISYIGYLKKNSKSILILGLAFAIFGISHLISFLGFSQIMTEYIIAIRVLAYLMVTFAIIVLVVKIPKKESK